jgi:hypothetical protein
VRLVIRALREVSKVVRAVWKVVFILRASRVEGVEGRLGWKRLLAFEGGCAIHIE